MHRTVVIDVVGLTPNLLGPSMPRLSAWARDGRSVQIEAVTPAVTCTAQATYVTGKLPCLHGIVGNGWYFRDECEVKFWRQSNRLIQGPRLWEVARRRDPAFTCATLFWWYNMYASVDISITPRPMYPADGRKLPDIYTRPADIRDALQAELGQFPLFEFWGPRASLPSSIWIADAARWIEARYQPTLSLVYLPHLDYSLQRLGPQDPRITTDLADIDQVCGDLIDYFEGRGVQVIVLSEYGITQVSRSIPINRILRSHGLLAVREELGLELLDPGASAAFAVADHQIAHVYVNDPARLEKVQRILLETDGIEAVLDGPGKEAWCLDHPRAGELIAIARPDAWFNYYYWLEDARAPDFARTVDIHRKPGYDPVELFMDPSIRLPFLTVGAKLLWKALGFRTLMDVIPLDASLVKGSHGRVTDDLNDGPVFITRQTELVSETSIHAIEVSGLILRHIFPTVWPRVQPTVSRGPAAPLNGPSTPDGP